MATTAIGKRGWPVNLVDLDRALLGVLGPAGQSQLGRLRGVLDVTGRRTP